MRLDDFVKLVQTRGHIGSRDDAMKAISSTLNVLSQRLFGGEAHDIASQLPTELKPFLEISGPTGSFDLDEFYKRVSALEGVDLPKAVFHARVVVSVLMDAISIGEIEDFLSQLPADYAPLFELEEQRGFKEAA